MQKKLRREGELIDSLSKLSQFREQGGEKAGKSGAGSGGGLKNTFKKMKPAGKKKRQRNVTAPEISAEALKGLRKEQQAKPAKESVGRGLFGKKPAKSEKEGGSPRKAEQEREKVIREEETNLQELAGDRPLSQKSDSHLSEYAPPISEDALAPPVSTLSHSKTDSAISYHQQPDLSQLSLSSSIPEEAGSTQSSIEGVALEQLAPPTLEVGSGGGSQEVEVREEVVEKDFRKGCPELYDGYGDEQHKLNLKHVLKFLESCNEASPVDLSCLVDWDGWTLASKEVM